MRIGIRLLDQFVLDELSRRVSEKYGRFQILSEGDLQALVCRLVEGFLRKHRSNRREFQVRNQPYLKGSGIYPNLGILRFGKPWVLIELKEKSVLREGTIQRARRKLNKACRMMSHKPQRAYVICVARAKERKKVTTGASGTRWLRVVPVLPKELKSIKTWRAKRKEARSAWW